MKENTETVPLEDEIEAVDESSGEIIKPFDPNLVNIKTPPTNLGDLIERLENNELNLSPDFQRHANLWNPQKQSRLIESVLMRLPLPAFYFDGQDDNKWQVVDGLQRISTLKNFAVDKTLKLTGLEFLSQFNDNQTGFDDLPRELQRRIKTFPITVYVIERGTPEDVKYNIFSRINEGGLKLEPQEIRHALNQGIPAVFVKELAEIPAFTAATCNIIKTQRMEDRDFATRFASFYLIDYHEYKPDLNTFLHAGMKRIGQISEQERNQLRADFERTMVAAQQIFGNDAFRKRYNNHDKRKPINKALFEALSVNIARLSPVMTAALVNRSELFKEGLIDLMNTPAFIRAISQGTGQKENVGRRFSMVAELINRTLSA